jgi:hypothetical protein
MNLATNKRSYKTKTLLIRADESAASIAHVLDILDCWSFGKHFNGFFEIVHPKRLSKPFCMVADEEGLLKGLPKNEVGSFLYETDNHGIPIVGDVFLLKETLGLYGYEFAGLTDREVSALCKKYGLIITL